MKFITSFLKNPREIGAIAPSSKGLANLITDTANLKNKKCVVELGSGTGIFTKEILNKINPNCLFYSLEINQKFVKETRNNCPTAIVYHASALNIQKYLSMHNKTNCDCVISGLPWAIFKKEETKKILDQTYKSLKDGGEFLTFAYLPGNLLPCGIAFKRQLNEKFSSVNKTKIIWKNLPPAFIYHCKK